MRRQTIVLFAIAAVLSAAVWLAWQRRDELPPAAQESRGAGAADQSSAVPAHAFSTKSAEAATAEADRTAVEQAPATAPSAADATVRLHGTIVVVDESGAEHVPTNGSFQVELQSPVPSHPAAFLSETVAATVTDGRWETLAPTTTTRLSVAELVLDGRLARCEDKMPLAVGDAPIVLRASWLESMRLRVIASDTGVDLTGIRVVEMVWHQSECTHPGDAARTPVLADGVSPLRLKVASRLEQERYWIQAPGYAWSQVTLFTAERGERVLRLVPGGDIELTVVGELPKGSVLRVRAEEGSGAPVAEFQLTGRTLRIDALPAGRWSLAIEKGSWFRDPMALGGATVEVNRGTITSASIQIAQAPERPALVQVQGTLQVDAAFGNDIAVELEPMNALRAWSDDSIELDADLMTEIGPGRFRWGPREVLAGRYGISVRGAGHMMLADVGPQPVTEVDVVVPAPGRVRVRLVDATSGAPIAKEAPGWYCSRPDGWETGWSLMETREIGDGWYEFTAPAGRISISSHPEGYSWTSVGRDVVAGANEFVLPVKRVCGVEILLKDGDVVLPWPDHAEVELANPTTRTGVAYWSGNRVAAMEAGEHTLTIRGIDGYEPIPEQTVIVQPGQWTKVEIVLRRRN